MSCPYYVRLFDKLYLKAISGKSHLMFLDIFFYIFQRIHSLGGLVSSIETTRLAISQGIQNLPTEFVAKFNTADANVIAM